MFKSLAVASALAASLACASPCVAQDQPPAAGGGRQEPATPPGLQPTIRDGQALIQQEKFEEAAEVFRAITVATPDNPQAWHLLGYSLHAAGKLDEALPCHLMAAEFSQSSGIAAYNVACVYALKGNKDKAFAWLVKSRAAGFSDAEQVENDSDLASLHDDPRYAAYVKTLSQTVARPDGALRETTGPKGNEERGVPSPNPKRTGANASAAGSASAKPMSVDEIAKLPAEKQMDFWLGTWEVTRASGDGPVAKNVIDRDLDDQMILETYTAPGFKGVSMHYYDPSRKHWAQFWVDTRGVSVLTYATFREGALRGEGERILPDGKACLTRFVITPNADGSVRQFIENSTDEGKTWTTYFDGSYRRAGS